MLATIEAFGGVATSAHMVARLRKEGHATLEEATLLVALRRLRGLGLLEDRKQTRRGHKGEYSVRYWVSTRGAEA